MRGYTLVTNSGSGTGNKSKVKFIVENLPSIARKEYF